MEPDFTAERETLAVLAELLIREREALVKGDLDALEPLGAQKAALVERLERLLLKGHLRDVLAPVSPADRPARQARLAAWLAKQSSTVQAAWRALLQEAARLQDLNRLNAYLVEQRLALCRQALAVLTPAGDASVYGDDGRWSTASATRERARI